MPQSLRPLTDSLLAYPSKPATMYCRRLCAVSFPGTLTGMSGTSGNPGLYQGMLNRCKL